MSRVPSNSNGGDYFSPATDLSERLSSEVRNVWMQEVMADIFRVKAVVCCKYAASSYTSCRVCCLTVIQVVKSEVTSRYWHLYGTGGIEKEHER